jgi:S-adenosyl-L-methionine hydrolase (adenosine-forming)
VLACACGDGSTPVLQHLSPQDIAAGAWVLHTAWRHVPAGAIFLCAVDPGVGGARCPIALAAGDGVFVGPDNGLFSDVLRDAPPANEDFQQ